VHDHLKLSIHVLLYTYSKHENKTIENVRSGLNLLYKTTELISNLVESIFKEWGLKCE